MLDDYNRQAQRIEVDYCPRHTRSLKIAHVLCEDIVSLSDLQNGQSETRFETDDELPRHPDFESIILVSLDEVSYQLLKFAAITPRRREELLAHVGRSSQFKEYRKLILLLETVGLVSKPSLTGQIALAWKIVSVVV